MCVKADTTDGDWNMFLTMVDEKMIDEKVTE